jgi:PEP-CTERM motif
MNTKRRQVWGASARHLWHCAACMAIVASPAIPLAAQTSTFVTGTTYSSDPLNTFETFGQYMLGIGVHWTYTDGTTGSSTFGPFIGPGNDLLAGVKKDGFMLGLGWNSDTFMDSWFVANNTGKSISSIRLNGQPGKVVFDCNWTSTECATVGGNSSTQFGSLNSARGWTFQAIFYDPFFGPVTGEYANLVGLGGAPPVGDIFEQFTMRFANGFDSGNILGFKLDTDNTSGIISERVPPPPVTSVPEPSTIVLLAVGLASIVALKRQLNRAT